MAGIEPALAEGEALASPGFSNYLPFLTVRADLLRRAGRSAEAAEAYDAALSLSPAPAEAAWLRKRREAQSFSGSA